MLTEILSQVKTPKPLHIDMSVLRKGINNYHYDVELSLQFRQDVEKLVKELITEEASLKANSKEHKSSFLNVRKSYLDMMTVLFHSKKTGLTIDEITFLQFSVPKFILLNVKENLDIFITKTRDKSNTLRDYGSAKVLELHEHLAWLKKNFNTIYYNIVKQVFKQLQRVESLHLCDVRKQYFNSDTNYVALLYNPMLMTKKINHPLFLIDHHFFLNNKTDFNKFNELNLALEKIFNKILPDRGSIILKDSEYKHDKEQELYNSLNEVGALGGLALVMDFLDPLVKPDKNCREVLSWAENSNNIHFLFNLNSSQPEVTEVRTNQGLHAWIKVLLQVKKVQNLLKKSTKIISTSYLLPQFIATYEARFIWNKRLGNKLSPQVLCQFLAGIIPFEKLLENVFKGQELSDDEIEIILNSAQKITTKLKLNSPELFIRILADFCEFRLQLKQYRFTHQIFNQINLLNNKDEIILSKNSNTLYRLPQENESEERGKRVLHHTILKANIYGADKVTEELKRSELSPSAYFSLGFFDPINAVLTSYGANKVFVNGNSLTLSFLEHEHSPQQWYSVAYACGLAKDILSIVNENNRHSNEMGLPTLELGIGISYSNEAPHFLYDGNHSIMISSAIAQAEKLTINNTQPIKRNRPNYFNVSENEASYLKSSSNDQKPTLLTLNDNGILLQSSAFTKLNTEIDLSKVSITIGNHQEELYYGEYKDVFGKKKELIIRPGKVDLGKNYSYPENIEAPLVCFEVVCNSLITPLVREAVSIQVQTLSKRGQFPQPSLHTSSTSNNFPFIH